VLINFGQILRINKHIPQFGQFWADFKYCDQTLTVNIS
jgi:hypothetical protein